MNIFQVSYKNLLRKKIRTSFTVIGIALSTWVLVTLLGFNAGYEKSLNKDIEGMGFQIVLTAKGCPYEAATLMLKGGTGLRYMPESVIQDVNTSPEVDQTTSMLMHAEFDPNKGDSGGVAICLGINPATYPQMKPYFEFEQGNWFKDENAMEVVFGYEAAELEQREVGDLYLVNTKNGEVEVKVSGILKRTGTQDDGMIFIPLRTAQKIFDKQGKLTMLGIRLQKEADTVAFEEKLYKLPDVQVVSMAQVRNTIMNLVSSAKVIVLSIAFIAFLIAMFGVLNTILMSVFERYQEIGILKSMGATPRNIFTMVWLETTILCSVGGIIGIIFSFVFASLAEMAIRYFLPFAPSGSLVDISINITIFSFVAITLTGIVGGLYPAWKASRFRPLDAIRSE
jgi:putative ABC transport system permease protein